MTAVPRQVSLHMPFLAKTLLKRLSLQKRNHARDDAARQVQAAIGAVGEYESHHRQTRAGRRRY